MAFIDISLSNHPDILLGTFAGYMIGQNLADSVCFNSSIMIKSNYIKNSIGGLMGIMDGCQIMNTNINNIKIEV